MILALVVYSSLKTSAILISSKLSPEGNILVNFNECYIHTVCMYVKVLRGHLFVSFLVCLFQFYVHVHKSVCALWVSDISGSKYTNVVDPEQAPV